MPQLTGNSKFLYAGSFYAATMLAALILAIGIIKIALPEKSVHAQGSSTYLVQSVNNVAGCTPSSSYGSQCFVTVNWPTSFSDTHFAVVCTSESTDPFAGSGYNSYDIVAPSTSQFKSAASSVIVIRNLSGNTGISVSSIDCVGMHN